MYSLFTKLINPDGWARRILGRKRAVILLYHSPKPQVFESHLEHLSKHYQFITLGTLVAAVESKNWEAIPKNAMVVTFDDGHASNYNLRLLFKQYQLRPTIYLCTSIVGTFTPYWWSGLEKSLVERLKRVANQDRIDLLTTYITSSAVGDREALSKAEIEEMQHYVDFGSHTRTHPIVTTLHDNELPGELAGPLTDLAEMGIQTSHFAYPNGDYADREVNFLRQVGYRSARTTDAGWVNTNSDLYRLPIMGITDNASINKLRWQLSGLFGWLLYLRQGGKLNGKKETIKIQ